MNWQGSLRHLAEVGRFAADHAGRTIEATVLTRLEQPLDDTVENQTTAFMVTAER